MVPMPSRSHALDAVVAPQGLQLPVEGRSLCESGRCEVDDDWSVFPHTIPLVESREKLAHALHNMRVLVKGTVRISNNSDGPHRTTRYSTLSLGL